MPPVGAAIAAFAASITATVSAALVAVGGWSGIVAFLTSPFGALVLGIGLQLVTSLFLRKPQAPSIEAAKVNVRLPEPERWISAGLNRVGGGVLFAEFDADGNFWYLIVHSDSILTETVAIYFDDEEIEIGVDESSQEPGFVISENFVRKNANTINDPMHPLYPGKADVAHFKIYTTTYTESNPIPPAIDDFKTAFTGVWTDDHKLVGTTYSVVKIRPVKPEDRYKIFRWRGALGIGEPSLSIVGNWSNVYDPREISHTLGDRTTYEFSRNPVLLWAWYRTHRYGRNKPASKINWDKVAEQASICDANRTDIDGGNAPFWQCDISIPESTERTNGEQQILISCDAQLVFDDDGKCWPRVGYHYDTDLKLVRNRDIVAMESVEAQNGESLTQGVIVRYIDPDANYTAQPCAPYVNPFYYVEGEAPKYLVVDALAIQNHRQAMQLAKSISHRSQPEHKLLPTVGLRGLRARQERIVNILYDNEFAGDYEIVTPTEVDGSGAFVGFGCVPIDLNRWTLLPGEEKSKPITTDSFVEYLPELPSNVVIEIEGRLIKISCDQSTREDWFYEFQYQEKIDETPNDDQWLSMSNVHNGMYFSSGIVNSNSVYFIRWRTVSTGGENSEYISPIPSIDTSVLVLSGIPSETGFLTPSTDLTPSTPIVQGKFIRRTTGIIDNSVNWEYVIFPVTDDMKYLASGTPESGITALLVFYDVSENYIGHEAVADGTEYIDYEFKPPLNTAFVGMTQPINHTNEMRIRPKEYTEFQITVTGGVEPYLFQDIYNRLPDGLTINPSTGIVSGEPNSVGTYAEISIKVSDNIGNFKNFPNFQIEVL